MTLVRGRGILDNDILLSCGQSVGHFKLCSDLSKVIVLDWVRCANVSENGSGKKCQHVDLRLTFQLLRLFQYRGK